VLLFVFCFVARFRLTPSAAPSAVVAATHVHGWEELHEECAQLLWCGVYAMQDLHTKETETEKKSKRKEKGRLALEDAFVRLFVFRFVARSTRRHRRTGACARLEKTP